MKQLSLLSKTIVLMVALVAMALPARADRVVNQLQFGKQTIEVAADEVITFYDMNGYQGISSSSSNTCFARHRERGHRHHSRCRWYAQHRC